MILRAYFLALFGLVALPAAAAPSPAMNGFYGGGYGTPPNYVYTQLDLTAANGSITGAVLQPYHRAGKLPITDVRIEGRLLHFVAGGLTFDLQRRDPGYDGTVRTPDGMPERAAFALRPGGPKPEVLARYEGTYDLGKGRLLTLTRNNATSGFWYLDLPSGRAGYLFNQSDTEFIAGMCFYCVDPVRMRIRVEHDLEGFAERLSIIHLNDKITAPRARLSREQPVTFMSRDGTKLAGSVFLPMRSGPFPALVMTHGSGAQSRNGFFGTIRFLAEAYARRGIAVLAYDKRGVGGSQGDWEKASLDDLGDDAAAAVAALRARSDIDPKRVGMSGASQASWIIPLASRRVPDLYLMQIRSGSSPMGVEESEWRRLVLQMQSDGASQADIDAALRIRKMMDDYAKTGRNWEKLEAAFKAVESQYWAAKYIGGLSAKDAPDWPWLKQAFTYDTTRDFKRFRGPIQFLYGGHDFVPVAQAKPMLEAALGANRANTMIAIVPRANHDFYDARSVRDSDFPGLSRYVPGYFDCVTSWAAEQFGLPLRAGEVFACARLATTPR